MSDGVSEQDLTIAKYEELLSLSGSDLAQQWQQVEGYAGWILAHDSAGVGAAWVEVSQQSTVPLLDWLSCLLRIGTLRLDEIRNDQFDRALCASIRVGGANGAVLGDGDHVGHSSGIAVDGRGRREYDVGHVVLGHASEEGDRSSHIDAIVFQRDLAGLAHSLR